MMRCLANPSSRSGRGKRLWPGWQRGLLKEGVFFSWHVTASAEECLIAADCGDQTVTAVGGDGTINLVLNGFLRSPRPGQAMGVLYSGTSPDFCRFHNIPVAAAEALRTLLRGKIRHVDLARICLRNRSGEETRELFASSCNIGLGADTARFANHWRRYLGDHCGTLWGLVNAMFRHKTFACTLRIDGETHEFPDANHIVILKNPYIASGLRFDCSLQPDDGLLLAVVVRGRSRWGLWKLLPALYRGNLLQAGGVFARVCRHVVVDCDSVREVEYDGDPKGFTPVEIAAVPKILPLICENERKNAEKTHA